MRIVKCYDCGKTYDFDRDDFCPGCGAFTQPPRTARIDMDGNVVRVDGLNERNHAGSFVHAELHDEKRSRKGTALERTRKAPQPMARRLSAPLKPRRKSGLDIGLDLVGDALKLFTDLMD